MDKAKILVIDDQKGPRESLRMVLKDDYEVALAETPFEGLRLVKEFQPDVVFLDIRMPQMEGTEVLRRIKETEPSIEVAMITAYAAVESAQEAVRYGAIDYLTKPFAANDVLRELSNGRCSAGASGMSARSSWRNSRQPRTLSQSNCRNCGASQNSRT